MSSELEGHSMDVEFKTRAVILDLLKLKKQAQARLDSDSALEAQQMQGLIDTIDDSINKFRFSGWFGMHEEDEDNSVEES